MSIIQRFGQWLYLRALRAQKSTFSLQPRLTNKGISILLLTDQESLNMTMIKDGLMELFQEGNLRIHTCTFQNIASKEKGQWNQFFKKDVHWYGIPKKYLLDEIENIAAEYVIGIHASDCTPLQFIATRFPQAVTIGPSYDLAPCYQINVVHAHSSPVKQFEAILKLLSTIHQPEYAGVI